MKSSGEAISVSYTVATLDARSEFSRLRRLLGSATPEAQGELDRLVDVLTDAYHARDGMVDDESYMAAREGFQDEIAQLEDELRDREAECEKLGGVVAELQETLKVSPDQLRVDNAALIAEKAGHEAEIARWKGLAERETATATRYAREVTEANAALSAANYRMASWSSDKTAAETADHYRIKYEEACKRFDGLRAAMQSAIKLAYQDAARSKVKREAIRAVESGVESLLRLSK
ncbi:MAG: hypothetical protein ACYDDA_12360 [Acidiferrobacteraceae bacterium]